MDLPKILTGVGLRDVEAKVYLAALELGEGTAAEIAKRTRLKRPSVYVILRDLIRKGTISSYSRQKIARFVALDPNLLVSGVLTKARAAEAALPELTALLKTDKSGSKPAIQYFEGLDGIITVMEDTLITGNKTVCAWANMELAWKVLRDYYPTYIKQKNERGVFVKAVLENNAVGRMFQERGVVERREVRLVERGDYPMMNEINIYDDKISIISHADLVGLIIQNQKIADTQRAIFELNWSALR